MFGFIVNAIVAAVEDYIVGTAINYGVRAICWAFRKAAAF